MIVDSGNHLLNSFLTGNFAEEISIGSSEKAVDSSNFELDSESYRGRITARSLDSESNTISYKIELPVDEEYLIREVGLWGYSLNDPQVEVIKEFDINDTIPAGAEGFSSDPPFSINGRTSLYTANDTWGKYLLIDNLNSRISAGDRVKVLMNFIDYSNVEVSQHVMTVKFFVDDDNYFESTKSVGSNTYHSVVLDYDEFIKVGDPDAGFISSVALSIGTGQQSMLLIGEIRKESVRPDGLISRHIIDPPMKKPVGENMDIEVPLRIVS